MSRLDSVEAEYELAMRRTMDSDALLELSIGLNQYRSAFKRPRVEWDNDDDD